MPLQNRVSPTGAIIATRARGAWLGNRGVIHNHNQEIVRAFRLKAWITCVLQFKGRYREVMTPNRWTELFFLDEATAFSAGHRPCFQCRYKDHQRFKHYWLKGNPQHDFDMRTPVAQIDSILQQERINGDGLKVTFDANVAGLPDGTFVLYQNVPHLVKQGKMYPWTPGGYLNAIDTNSVKQLPVLTPFSIVQMFRAGYVPQIDLLIIR